MELFRIVKQAYSKKLTCSGAPNRWNIKGQLVLYAGTSRSLSTLELVVHRGSVIPAIPYKMMVISLADHDHLVKQLRIKDLPANWRSLAAYASLQKIGSAWAASKETLALKVPSAVISQEFNYVINTEHPDFKKHVKLVRTEEYFWDGRLR